MPENKGSLDGEQARKELTHWQLFAINYLGLKRLKKDEKNSPFSVFAGLLGAYRFSYNFMECKETGSEDSQPAKRASGGVYSAIAAPFTMPFDILANIFCLPLLTFGHNDVTACISGLTFPNQAAVLVDFNETNSEITEGLGKEGAHRKSAKPKKIIANILSGAILGLVAYCPIRCLLSPETLPGFVKGMHWMPALNWLDTALDSLGSLAPIQVILQVTTVIALVTAIERAASKEGKVDAGDIARIATAFGMCFLPILVPALCHLDISAQLILQGLALAGFFAAIGYAREKETSKVKGFTAIVLALGICTVPILVPALCHLDLSGMSAHIAVALFFAMPIVNNVMQAFAGHAKGKAADDLTKSTQPLGDGADGLTNDLDIDPSRPAAADSYVTPALQSNGKRHATSDHEDDPAASPGTGGG